MRRQRILLTLTAVLVGTVVLQEPAGAYCLGPTVSHPAGEFERLSSLTVTGQHFGDNCYDAGSPPEGEGILGQPLADLEVVFVQDDAEWVVATGRADENYEFAVEITIPVDASAGEARIGVRWPGSGGELFASDPSIIVLESPIEGAGPPAATFGGAATSATATTVDEPADDDSTRATWIAAGMVIAAAAVGGLLVLSKR